MSLIGIHGSEFAQRKHQKPFYQLSKFYQGRLLKSYHGVESLLEKVVKANQIAKTEESITLESNLRKLRAELHPAHSSITDLTKCIRFYASFIFDELGVLLQLQGDTPRGDFEPFILSVITDLIELCCQCASRCREYQLNIELTQNGNSLTFEFKEISPSLLEAVQAEPLLPALALCLNCGDSVCQLDFCESSVVLSLHYVGELALPNREEKKLKPSKPALALSYIDRKGQFTSRGITPIKLSNEDGEYQLLAHCHVRDDIRTFNINSVVGQFVCVKTGMPITLDELNALCANQEEYAATA